MQNDFTFLTRPRRMSAAICVFALLGGLIAWGYARSGSSERPPLESIEPVVSLTPKTTATSTPDEDVRGRPASQEKPSTGGLIGALRQQVAQSPLLQEGDTSSSLLDSLDRAGDIWTKTQRQNREALRQLKRQVRIGESRQAPHLVLITFDRPNSTRDSLFAELGERGVSFRQHYAGGESTVSGWWTLMTGRNTGRARRDEFRFAIRETEQTLAAALWQAGYTTGLLGLWTDRVAPLDCGFDHWTGLQKDDNPVPLFPGALETARNKMTISANGNGREGASLWKLLSLEVESFMADQARQQRPFYLQIRLPGEVGKPSPSMSDSPEHVVEQVFTSLRKAGWEDRTCVCITTLTGQEAAGSHPLSELALRVPLVMIGAPNTTPGSEFAAPSAAWDLLPTMLDIAQATRRSPSLDGRSLVGTTSLADRLLFWETDRVGQAQAVRKRDWKGTAKADERQLRLYHLPSDPHEEKNVAADHPDVVQELLAPAPSTADNEFSASSRADSK